MIETLASMKLLRQEFIMYGHIFIKHRIFHEHEASKLSGAAEARRAHNPEDIGSKPISANIFFFAHVI